MATPTERNTEQIQELKVIRSTLLERVNTLARASEEGNEQTEKMRSEVADARREVADLRTENALLQQQLDEFRKWIDKWDTRLWAVVAGYCCSFYHR